MANVGKNEWEAGAGDGNRTRDIQLGKLTLYQLSYARSLERRESLSGTLDCCKCVACQRPTSNRSSRSTRIHRATPLVSKPVGQQRSIPRVLLPHSHSHGQTSGPTRSIPSVLVAHSLSRGRALVSKPVDPPDSSLHLTSAGGFFPVELVLKPVPPAAKRYLGSLLLSTFPKIRSPS